MFKKLRSRMQERKAEWEKYCEEIIRESEARMKANEEWQRQTEAWIIKMKIEGAIIDKETEEIQKFLKEIHKENNERKRRRC